MSSRMYGRNELFASGPTNRSVRGKSWIRPRSSPPSIASGDPSSGRSDPSSHSNPSGTSSGDAKWKKSALAS